LTPIAAAQAGMRASEHYPNTRFNIFFDIEGFRPTNFEKAAFSQLQSALAKNYPKARPTKHRAPARLALLRSRFFPCPLQPDAPPRSLRLLLSTSPSLTPFEAFNLRCRSSC
jgi:hypothetical protein